MISTYIVWLALFFWLPTAIVMATLGGQTIKNYRGVYVFVTAGSVALGYFWDLYAITHGIWYYKPWQIYGWFLGIPIDEWMFLLTVPSFIVSVYLIIERIAARHGHKNHGS